jgi:hypothetical protein
MSIARRNSSSIFACANSVKLHALKPPILTGQLPVLQNISPNRNQACASCHMPYACFTGPIPSANLTMVAFPGTVHFRAGKWFTGTSLDRAVSPRRHAAEQPISHDQRVKQYSSKMGDEREE